jgi:iron complex outermembrane receptor protein
MDQVVNLADSTIKGLEASVQSRLAGLGINAGVSYTDSVLGSIDNPAALVNGGVVASYLLPLVVQNVPALFPASTFDYTPYTHNISGQQNPYSPKFTANVSLDYAIEVGKATVRPLVSFSHTGKQHGSIFQRDNFYLIPARNLWDASISYENGTWLTQAYVKNLADTVYVAGYSGNAVYYGDPRQFGLRVRKSF